jgi:ferredoxin
MVDGDLGQWVTEVVRGYVNGSPENSMQNEAGERIWADPLMAFSSGADPLYPFYKEDIGSFFKTPVEWFKAAYPDIDVGPNELTVISWILPQTQATKAEHRLPRRMPTERWARARIMGEEFNAKLRGHVVETLNEAGFNAVSPMIHTDWARHTSEKYNFASNWSERHAAYTAGLGTFGLCDALITPRGKAMRSGSAIARIDIPASPRPYEDHHAYCLWYAKGECKECVAKCPANAISEAGHDKEKCSAYLQVTRRYVEETFKFKGYGCGLCQTGVACESGIPEELRV